MPQWQIRVGDGGMKRTAGGADTLMKVTGVYFSFDKEKQQKENYKEINENLRKLLKLWKQRGISLIGRVQIIKNLCFFENKIHNELC